MTGDIHAIIAVSNILAANTNTCFFHDTTQYGTTLFNRVCPMNKEGKQNFVKIMKKHLVKLDIHKDYPDDLTPEDVNKFARFDIDPESITWRRVIYVNYCFLRKITVGQEPYEKGI